MEFIYNILNMLPFEFIKYDFMKNALIAVIVITPLFAMLGTMAVNNKMAFFSDALGHSAFTGIAIGILLGLENPVLSMVAFGILLGLVISRVKSYRTASADTIISVFSSVSVALGIVILSKNGGFSKYSSYLIGDILIVTPGETAVMLAVLAVCYAVWFKIYNRLLLISINQSLASSRGITCAVIENIFVVMLSVSVMLSVKWIGILTINSFLILPPAAARNIAVNSRQYHFYSLAVGMLCGIAGLIISFYADTSAGATMVLVSAAVYFVTLVFKKGVRK
ncbi:metal ABC transporter permease [Lachnospiraceae bacterium NSJ-143]|nr:metal ABC transporter permease [Lachnospiraceae bacterium NSJ-143]